MKYVGAHVSIAGGVENAPVNAFEIGAKAFAMFTKNQKQWEAPPLKPSQIDTFNNRMKQFGFSHDKVLVHDSYLINIGNPEKEKRKKSVDALLDEMLRVEQLGLFLLNFHPGSHLQQITESDCIKYVAEGINTIFEKTNYASLVLETTAGQGSNIGYRFEHLAEIISMVENKSRIGVCIDTCHIYAAGYDIKSEKGYHSTMNEFDKIIGFDMLKGVHANDSKSSYQSKVDRHESLGKGNLGLEPFKFLMNDSRFDNIPITLETIDETIWKEEIELLYSFEKVKSIN